MMTTTIQHQCRTCGSLNIVKNGRNRHGNQQDLWKACRASGVLTPQHRYTPEDREQILRAYQERPSMRGIERIFGVSRITLGRWIKNTPNVAVIAADPSTCPASGSIGRR